MGQGVRHQHARNVHGDQTGPASDDGRKPRSHREPLAHLGPARRRTYSKVPYSAYQGGNSSTSAGLWPARSASGITVNCVPPAPIDTDIMGKTLTDERKGRVGADSMVGRVGTA